MNLNEESSVFNGIQLIKDENHRLKCEVSRLSNELKEEAMMHKASEIKLQKCKEDYDFRLDEKDLTIKNLEKSLCDSKEEASNYLLAIRSLKNQIYSIENLVNNNRQKRRLDDSPQKIKRQKLNENREISNSYGIWSRVRRVFSF